MDNGWFSYVGERISHPMIIGLWCCLQLDLPEWVAILFGPYLQNDCNYIATFVAKGRGIHLKLGGQLANYTEVIM